MARLIEFLAIALAASAGVATAARPQAQDYPHRPIRFIVPFPPGGANDIVARLVGPKLSEDLGQQIVVDNRAGASGNIGVELAARAQPDGYTYLVGNTTTNGINPTLFETTMKVNAAKDLIGVSLLGDIPHVIITDTRLPPNTFQELIAYAKARPGELNYIAPLGSHPHLDMLALAKATGIQIVHLPSRGAGDTIPTLLRGEAQISNSNVASVIGFIRSGRIKAFAVTSARRLPELADVPTFSEVGLEGIGSTNWVGVFAPTRTPRAIISKLHAVLAAIMQKPEMLEAFTKRLVRPAVSASPSEFNTFVQSEILRWGKIIKVNNVRLE